MSANHARRSAAARAPFWSALVVVVALGTWEGLARLGLISAVFFPPPSVVAQTFVQDVRAGQLLADVGATIRRALPALVLGGLPAVIAGILLGWLPRLRAVAEPIVAALHPIPKLALLPLVLVIVGINEMSVVVVAAVAAFFPLVINTMTGVRLISRAHFEVAESYGASRARLLLRVVLPGSLPMMLAGVRLAANIALVTIIAIEMITSDSGLGARVWLSWQVLRTERLYAALLAIAILGVAVNMALLWLERRLVPWRDD